MNKIQLFLITTFSLIISQLPVMACSGFLVEEDGLVLVGNNEDYWNPFTKMWIEKPEDGKLGAIYFGYDDLHPQGGMNEAGLVFDFFATAPKPVKRTSDKKDITDKTYQTIMQTCRTVEEALAFMDELNPRSMERYMTFFADQNGNSAIVEGDKVIQKEGNFQVVTNFYQSDVPNGKDKSGESVCWRYEKANQLLRDGSKFNKEKAKKILSAISQKGKSRTLYSNIYDVKNGIVYLYHYHNFDDEVVIDLQKELKKEDRGVVDIPVLFPENPKATAFTKETQNKLKKRAEKYDIMDVSTSILQRYCQSYISNGQETSVLLQDGKLFLEVEMNAGLPLVPISETKFFGQLFMYDFVFEFDVNENKNINGFTMNFTYYGIDNTIRDSKYFSVLHES